MRARTVHGTTTTETVYGITSLPRAKADATRLPTLVRQHWSVEMVFHARGVTLGEDAGRARTGPAPFVLSTLRNAAVTLLGQNPATAAHKAAAVRRHAARPGEALALVRGYG